MIFRPFAMPPHMAGVMFFDSVLAPGEDDAILEYLGAARAANNARIGRERDAFQHYHSVKFAAFYAQPEITEE